MFLSFTKCPEFVRNKRKSSQKFKSLKQNVGAILQVPMQGVSYMLFRGGFRNLSASSNRNSSEPLQPLKYCVQLTAISQARILQTTDAYY